MTHHDAFLADICLNPDDDAPRLVYADWLEDHGDADRAHFIRVQVALARIPAGHPQARALDAEAQTRLRPYEATWRSQLPAIPGVTWEDFSRGFVESVFVDSVQFFDKHRARIFAAAPIRRLRVGDISSSTADRLSRLPHLRRLTELNLGNNPGLERVGVAALAESPHVANLEVLLLHYANLGDEAIEDLARSKHLGRLRELYLSGNDLGDRAALAIAASQSLPALAELDLRDNRIGAAGARALANYGNGRLETLWLVNNQVGPEGCWALAGTESLPALARLYLNYNPLRDDAGLAFACSPHRAALRELDLRHSGLGDRGALALAESPYLAGLEQLWLGGNRLRIETLAQLRRLLGERLRL